MSEIVQPNLDQRLKIRDFQELAPFNGPRLSGRVRWHPAILLVSSRA